MEELNIIKGKTVDNESRCVHWHSPLDVIALKFKCCEAYYCCYTCHQELVTHEVERYTINGNCQEKVILCGVCKYAMTFDEYRNSEFCDSKLSCPKCHAHFNPGCKLHYDLYFKIAE
ncbi:hypothetical protein Kpol_461p18 [Vanderwaltozyma polyspora DSM 70294]|uniref:CHY-type domain-containing protein n=1 Tax=Vanderwaltozyma polyspora (strain ATCC 22028 / DSM 70294 / BCRC 21397 / CBS 2163 / NBRC 10782 / NRRL Y-8283 / UCD 57-17) TaxID=436907 RepID=A7TR54_VANPO|nr:uncharacterized protein Kpol_461p18 [Vanderwaltozyma polyspora DSM 70294]EDO15264.1 hypothetical protein Kpol_461p18 [Vanderwaltozyma polyspora DSM 70294]